MSSNDADEFIFIHILCITKQEVLDQIPENSAIDSF
jgi:hypothetical protein